MALYIFCHIKSKKKERAKESQTTKPKKSRIIRLTYDSSKSPKKIKNLYRRCGISTIIFHYTAAAVASSLSCRKIVVQTLFAASIFFPSINKRKKYKIHLAVPCVLRINRIDEKNHLILNNLNKEAIKAERKL